jgi:hypothetical protein
LRSRRESQRRRQQHRHAACSETFQH